MASSHTDKRSSKRSVSDSHKSHHSSHSRSTSLASVAPYDPRANLPTLADVRLEAAKEMTMRAINNAEMVDGVRINVIVTSAKKEDIPFLIDVGGTIQQKLATALHLFAVATTGKPLRGDSNYIMFCASKPDYVVRADILLRSKFMDRCRVLSLKDLEFVPQFGERDWGLMDQTMVIAALKNFDGLQFDLPAVWDILRKSARTPVDPMRAPPRSVGIEERLVRARAKLIRRLPLDAYEELRVPEAYVPTVLVDIRSTEQRETFGSIDGALFVDRNELEWRFDPRSPERAIIVNRYDLRVIIIDHDGRASSLAAESLQDIGMLNATDVIGGFLAWEQARLPMRIPEQLSTSTGSGSTVINQSLTSTGTTSSRTRTATSGTSGSTLSSIGQNVHARDLSTSHEGQAL
ncbi:hypothetical protein CYLTODRAFT_397963 [Cylindrobasidium torrendii FP15055 ss-10]|uniref:Rhodanese domain-containing protein n=1 Tax=Cylindrobasidium torrendii FP15055 ss-10 TaxID=1314674 RepID=A0A0D7B8L2_9AGAR|nr:hypothetical protein CYLTODRAFT_397963 [Cylindrobasidium torrendii FP15055 ss-10]